MALPDDGTIPLHRAVVLMLEEWWRSPASRRFWGTFLGPPLIRTDDQEPNTDNPLWEIVRRWPTFGDSGIPERVPHIEQLPELHDIAVQLSQVYAVGVPTPGDLAWMAEVVHGRGLAGVVEVGAGTGYWAWQLEQVGVRAVASDIAPRSTQWVPVDRMEAAEAAATADGHALLMVWPPADDPMAHDALKAFPGDVLLYVGEPRGDACGDKAFWDLLADDWEPVGVCWKHVTFTGRHDTLPVLFERKRK